jgi:hypothetical protein
LRPRGFRQRVRDAPGLQPDSRRHRRLVEVERIAVGMAELPLGIAVKIEMVVAVDACA